MPFDNRHFQINYKVARNNGNSCTQFKLSTNFTAQVVMIAIFSDLYAIKQSKIHFGRFILLINERKNKRKKATQLTNETVSLYPLRQLTLLLDTSHPKIFLFVAEYNSALLNNTE